MRQTFEAEFGDFKIALRQARITTSPTEENELHVLLFDPDCDLKNFLASPTFPKGKACVKTYVKVPPHCPNCDYELSFMSVHYDLKELESHTYNGVSITIIPSYNEDVIELKLHYETLEYSSCYPKKTN